MWHGPWRGSGGLGQRVCKGKLAGPHNRGVVKLCDIGSQVGTGTAGGTQVARIIVQSGAMVRYTEPLGDDSLTSGVCGYRPCTARQAWPSAEPAAGQSRIPPTISINLDQGLAGSFGWIPLIVDAMRCQLQITECEQARRVSAEKEMGMIVSSLKGVLS